jgi:hypothetical protein
MSLIKAAVLLQDQSFFTDVFTHSGLQLDISNGTFPMLSIQSNIFLFHTGFSI